MEEVWVVLEDWPDYQISNYGRVYSNRRNRILKTNLGRDGYYRVNLSNVDGWKNISIHRLVALMFVSGYFDGAIVNHIDGDKTNNVVTNLEWVTHKENVNHAYSMGLNKGRGAILWKEG